MVANDDAFPAADALPTNEAELEAKARALRLNGDDKGTGVMAAHFHDPELLPEERWDDAWNGHLEALKVGNLSLASAHAAPASFF